jgi:DNA-binding transcriptional MerR regulator
MKLRDLYRHSFRSPKSCREDQPEDLRWVELAVCMRNAGLPIESLIEYQRLFRAGDSTIPALHRQKRINRQENDQRY